MGPEGIEPSRSCEPQTLNLPCLPFHHGPCYLIRQPQLVDAVLGFHFRTIFADLDDRRRQDLMPILEVWMASDEATDARANVAINLAPPSDSSHQYFGHVSYPITVLWIVTFLLSSAALASSLAILFLRAVAPSKVPLFLLTLRFRVRSMLDMILLVSFDCTG